MSADHELEAEEFLKANPEVWRLFCEFTTQAIRAGHQHFSADMIAHRIRWESYVATKGAGEADNRLLKLNNNITAYLARRWNRENPIRDGFFRTRRLRPAQKEFVL